MNTITIRNYLGFWLLGLTNNYAYVVMLSAAYDILSADFHDNKSNTKSSNGTDEFCNPISTGAVLIADIVPSLFIKFTAPFVFDNTNIRVTVAVILSAASFLLTSFSVADWMSYIGIACASLSSGLGEVTFLAYTSYFDSNVVSLWSSGTGAAGFLGAVSYAGLTTEGLSPRNTLLVMLIIPVIMAVTFWWMIIPIKTKTVISTDASKSENKLTLKEKFHATIPLLRYMIPLSLVYFLEYLINQGLFELVYFSGIWLSHKEQYRWYQVDYQFGVLISRSSVNLIHIRHIWIMPIFQALNLFLVLFEVIHPYLPTFWLMLAIVFFEGLIGGAAYVNTFYAISKTVEEKYNSYSMAIGSTADVIGITLAGVTSIPVHNALCKKYFM